MSRRKPTRKFKVVIEYDPAEPTPYKYGVYVPSLPNCFSEGRTREEALENIREVIALLHVAGGRGRPRRRVEITEVRI